MPINASQGAAATISQAGAQAAEAPSAQSVMDYHDWATLRLVEASPQHILDAFQIDYPPVPILKILRRMGVKVATAPRGHRSFLDARDGYPKIAVSESLDKFRARFQMGRMLGHLMRHPLDIVYQDPAALPSKVRHEATRFARDILIPESLVIAWAQRLQYDDAGLASAFAVPVSAVEYQLARLLRW